MLSGSRNSEGGSMCLLIGFRNFEGGSRCTFSGFRNSEGGSVLSGSRILERGKGVGEYSRGREYPIVEMLTGADNSNLVLVCVDLEFRKRKGVQMFVM